MQGNIDFTGSLSGSIAGGGSGGSDVTITPTLQSGTKIADYTIDETSGSLYAPTPEAITVSSPLSKTGSNISIDLTDYQEKLTAGSYIDIDSNNEISCTPPITNVWYTPEAGVQQDVLIGKFTVNEVTQNVYAPSGGGGVNYSTTEQDTGELWIDGTSHVFQKSFQVTLSGSTGQIDLSGLNISKAWIKDGFYDIGATCLSLNEFMGGAAYCYTHINQGLNPPYIDCLNTISANSTVYITIKYIKNSI